MAFTSILNSNYAVGKPVKSSLKITENDNIEDLNSRLSNIETIAQKVVVFSNYYHITNAYNSYTGKDYFTADFNFLLTDAKLIIVYASGLTGTFEVDVKKLTNVGSLTYTSIFTTKPSVAFPTVNNMTESTNAIFDNTLKNIVAGDQLRLDITGLPTGGIVKAFIFKLTGEV